MDPIEYPIHDRIQRLEAAGIRHKGLYSVNCVRIACSSGNITVLGSRQVFDERIFDHPKGKISNEIDIAVFFQNE